MVYNKEFVQYKIFRSYKNLVAFTTTKETFERNNPRFTGNTLDIYSGNREELAKNIGIKESHLIFPRQTHTNCVVEIDTIPKEEIENTDALFTNKSGICICVQTADCVPILLFDPDKNVISAVHAGWRGTVKNIVGEAVRKMISAYNSSPENIIAAIGPSISMEAYEVGSEVVERVRKTIPNADRTLHQSISGNFHFDLWEANKQLLLENGIQQNNMEILGECSFKKSEKYFSARREGIETGRMVSGIMLL